MLKGNPGKTGPVGPRGTPGRSQLCFRRGPPGIPGQDGRKFDTSARGETGERGDSSISTLSPSQISSLQLRICNIRDRMSGCYPEFRGFNRHDTLADIHKQSTAPQHYVDRRQLPSLCCPYIRGPLGYKGSKGSAGDPGTRGLDGRIGITGPRGPYG